MRPPVTRWAFNNVFVRMAVVAIAFLTGVAVLSGVMPQTAAIADPAEPRLHVGPPSSIVGQGGWIDGQTVTVVIDGPGDVYDRTETVVAGSDQVYGDSWRLEDDTLALAPGFTVTASDSQTTRVHMIRPIQVETVITEGPGAETVSGSTALEPGDWVEVAVFSDECRRRDVPVVDGLFTADFSVSGPYEPELNPDEEATCDLGPGSYGSVEQYDPEGNLTFIMWRVPNPSFSVEVPFQVWGGGGDWPVDIPVEVIVDNDAEFDLADSGSFLCQVSTVTASWGVNPWDQGFYVNFDDPENPCEIQPGHIVTVFSDADGVDGPEIYKDLVVVDLSITSVDAESGIIAGYAPPEEWVIVNGGNEFEGASRDVQAASVGVADPGYWEADLGTDLGDGSGFLSVPFASNTGGSAQVFDDDGDSTHGGWCHDCGDGGDPPPEAGFVVQAPCDIWGNELEGPVSIEIDRVATTEVIALPPMGLDEGGSWWVNTCELPDPFQIEPFDVVTATTTTTTRTLTVHRLVIYGIDTESGTISGSVEPQPQEVWASIWGTDPPVTRSNLVPDLPDGTFTFDLDEEPIDPNFGEGYVLSLEPGMQGEILALTSDAEGTITRLNWRVPNPSFSVEVPHQVWGGGEDWLVGIPVDVIVDDDATFDLGDSETYLCHASTVTEWWGENPWDQGFNVNFDDPENPCEIQPGHIVTVFSDADGVDGPEIYKDLVVVDLSMSVNPDSGIIAGYAPPEEWVNVNGGNEFEGVNRDVQAASVGVADPGYWEADLGTDLGDGSGFLSVPFASNTGGSAQVFDDDGDSTHRGWCYDCDNGGGDGLWMEPFSVEPGQVLISQTDGILWVYDPQANAGAGDVVAEHRLPFGGVWDIRWGDPGFLYLANSGNGRVLRLDMESGQFEVLFEGDPLSFPIGVAFDNREDSALFIADPEQGVFNLDIDGPGGIQKLSDVGADGIEFGPDGFVYFTTGGSDQVFQVDPYAATPTAVEVIGSDMQYRFNGLVFSPQGTLLATSIGPPAVVEFEHGSWKLLNEYRLSDAIFTEDVAVGLDGMLYVIDSSCDEYGCGSDPALWRIDRVTGVVEELVDHGPFGDVVDLLVMPDSPREAHMKVYSTTAAPGWSDIVDVEGLNQGARLVVERDGIEPRYFDPASEFEIDPGVWHALFTVAPFDLQPGDLVSVTDDDTTLSTVVTDLVLENVDRENLVLSGQARPEHALGVQFFPWREGELDGTLWETQIVSDSSGGWILDLEALGAPVDLGPGTWWSIMDLDAGTETGTYVEWFIEPELYVVLNPLALPNLPDFPDPDTSTVIGGAGWVLGGEPGVYAEVEVTVTDTEGDEKWSGTVAPDIGLPDAQPSEFGILNLALEPGDTVTAVQAWTAVGAVFGIDPPTWSRELVVGSATVTSIDVEADIISGEAEAGATLWMPHPQIDNESGIRLVDTTIETWVVDFGDDSELPAWDMEYGDLFVTAEIDDDGDGTWVFWQTPEPVLGVDIYLDGNVVYGDGWQWNTPVILTITDPDEDPVLMTAVVSDEFGFVDFGTIFEVFELAPGMVVVITDGIYTRSLKIEDYDYSPDPETDPGVNVDAELGTVSGYAEAGSEVCAAVSDTGDYVCIIVAGVPGAVMPYVIPVNVTYTSNVILTIIFDFTVRVQEIEADPPPDLDIDYPPGAVDGIDTPFDVNIIDYVTNPACGLPLQVTVNWGDGTNPYDNPNVAHFETLELTHTFPKAGVYTVSVTVVEPCSGFELNHSFEVQIENTVPEIRSFEGPIDPYMLGLEGFVSGAFFDPNSDDVISVEVDWGDGSDVTTPSFNPDSYTFDDSHFYSAPGIYTITLTVRDDSGGEAVAEYDSAVVFDPNGKSISGSPEVELEDASDKVDFSVSFDTSTGYPDGNLKYKHKDADEKVKFETDNIGYLWILGDWAVASGSGSFKSTGETYDFQLAVFDGDAAGMDDTFRFKLWNTETGEVFYDSQPGAPAFAFPTTVPTKGDVKIKVK